jgi:hypothetical protein
MRERRCHYCGQKLPEVRLGVRLTPLKARIFDLIQRGGDDGIMREDLQDILGMKYEGLKSHIYQINELIEDEDYRIVNGGSGYRLVSR